MSSGGWGQPVSAFFFLGRTLLVHNNIIIIIWSCILVDTLQKYYELACSQAFVYRF